MLLLWLFGRWRFDNLFLELTNDGRWTIKELLHRDVLRCVDLELVHLLLLEDGDQMEKKLGSTHRLEDDICLLISMKLDGEDI